MKSTRAFFGISRRVLLTTAAALPILFGPILPMSEQAQAQTDPLPISATTGRARSARRLALGRLMFLLPSRAGLLAAISCLWRGQAKRGSPAVAQDWVPCIPKGAANGSIDCARVASPSLKHDNEEIRQTIFQGRGGGNFATVFLLVFLYRSIATQRHFSNPGNTGHATDRLTRLILTRCGLRLCIAAVLR
jgi:hypothetical protein